MATRLGNLLIGLVISLVIGCAGATSDQADKPNDNTTVASQPAPEKSLQNVSTTNTGPPPISNNTGSLATGNTGTAPTTNAGTKPTATDNSPSSTTPTGTTGLTDQLERDAFGVVKKVFELFGAKQGVFYGGQFDIRKIPTYLVRRGADGNGSRGFLLNHTSPPTDAKLILDSEAGGLANVYRWDGKIAMVTPQFTYEFVTIINGVKTYVMPFNDGEFSFTEPQQVLLYIHEAFHRFQEVEGKWSGAQGVSVSGQENYPMTLDNIALALLEIRVLRDALGTTDKETKRLRLKQFYAVRSARLAQKTTGKIAVESVDRDQERVEGSALYIEEIFRVAFGYQSGPDSPAGLTSLDDRLGFHLNPYDGASPSELKEGLDGKGYDVGAAILFLLDSLGVQWTIDLAQGMHPESLVAKHIAPSPEKFAAYLADAKADFNFAEINGTIAPKYVAK